MQKIIGFLLILLICLSESKTEFKVNYANKFPKNFTWGTATSSYQIEGAWNKDGRGPSIWDTFSQTPGRTHEGDTGNIACDHYHKFKEDIKLMKEMGVNSYRFSISWSRIMPTGRGTINERGVRFYEELIEELLKNGIEPWVTLFHWDLPQGLQDDYGGMLNKDRFVDDFNEYAKFCFRRFGNRVKKWITFNEPYVITIVGHDVGVFAPGRCSMRERCRTGNSKTEPYIVGHNLLVAHAYAVDSYRRLFQKTQRGKVSITLSSEWTEPRNPNLYEDHQAAQRLQEFKLAWFSDPVIRGDYPESMKIRVRERLPTFTAREKLLLKGSIDYFAINCYTSRFVVKGNWGRIGFEQDSDTVEYTHDYQGKPIGEQAHPEWFWITPFGFRRLLNWINKRYGRSLEIYVTENGLGELNDPTRSIQEMLNDTQRVKFYQDYLQAAYEAMTLDGVNLKGYFAWSLLDNFEWAAGYSSRFGIHYVDFKSGNRTRYKKASAIWWTKFLQNQKN